MWWLLLRILLCRHLRWVTQISRDNAQHGPLYTIFLISLLRCFLCSALGLFITPVVLLFFPFLFPSGLQYQHSNLAKKRTKTSIWHKHNFKFVDWRFRARRCVSSVPVSVIPYVRMTVHTYMYVCMYLCMSVCLALFILQPHLVMQINLRGGYSHCFILHVGIDTKLRLTENVAVISLSV